MSRGKNPASSVAHRTEVVAKRLAEEFAVYGTAPFRMWCKRRAAWSKMKPGRGLALKKQILSDCDFRNLRSVDEGTGVLSLDRIVRRSAIVCIHRDRGAVRGQVKTDVSLSYLRLSGT